MARTITINFGGNAAGVERAAAQAERAVGRVSSRVAQAARSAARIAVLGTALATVSAYAVALAASSQRAAAAVLLLPAAFAAAAAASMALRAVTFGLGEAWKATGQKATGGGGAASDAGRQVAAAQRQVRAATRALADSQRDAVRAQQDVTRARQEEAARLKDLARSVAGARLDEEGSVRDLAAAEKALAEARKGGNADEIAEADYQYRRQLQTVDEVRARLAELEQEQTDGARKGVEGSDAVQAALERQREAQQQVTEAAERLAEAQDAVRQAGQKAASGGINPAAEALARLAPAARAVIRTLRDLQPAWEGAARAGQQATFRGVSTDLRDLSGIYLPRATRFLGRMGTSFNVAIRQSLGLFKTRDAARDVDTILNSTAQATDRLARAVRPVINGLLQWAAVGVGFLPDMAGSVGNIAERFEAWSVAARESGQAQQWIGNAVAMLRQFWQIATNVVGSVRAILKAGDDGGSTVDMLVRGSAALRAWLESAEGQQRVSAVLSGLRDIISGISAAATGADVPASAFFDTIKVGGTVASFLADHLDTLAKLLPVLAAGFVIAKVAQVGANIAAVAALPIRVAEVAANWGMRAALQAQTAALIQNTAVHRVATGAQVAETAATNGGILARGRAIVSMAAQRVAMVATAVATKAWAAAQWLINIAMSANPVGLIILAIIALIAIIVAIATKTTWFQTAWKYAWSAIQAALKAWWAYAQWVFGLIVSAIGWVKDRIVAGINGAILIFRAWQTAVGAVKDWIVGRLAALLNWITSLPGRIRSGLASVADIISAPFRAAFNAISRFWNNTAGRLRWQAPDWVPGFGGRGFSLPTLPQLQHGGYAAAGRSYLVGERGPEVLTMGPQSGRVTPNHALGGDTHVTVVIDGRALDESMVRVSRERDRGVRRRVLAGAGAAR